MTNEIAKTDESKVAKYTNQQIQLIHDIHAKNTTKEEFELYMYTAGKFGLDPLLKQIWCVKFKDQPAQIYAGRDGFLEIAHRSGQFNGLKSGMKDDSTAYAEVYRKDMDNPFYVEVDISEYSTGMALWKTKPKTMLTKVAESQALRRAFSITGIYSPEEMGQWELEAQGIEFNKVQPKAVTTTSTSNKTSTGAFPSNKEYWDKYDWDNVNLEEQPKPTGWTKTATGKPKPKPSFEATKMYFFACDVMPKEEVNKFFENVTDKKYGYTYGDIKEIVSALMLIWEQENALPVEAEPVDEEPVNDISGVTEEYEQELLK